MNHFQIELLEEVVSRMSSIIAVSTDSKSAIPADLDDILLTLNDLLVDEYIAARTNNGRC